MSLFLSHTNLGDFVMNWFLYFINFDVEREILPDDKPKRFDRKKPYLECHRGIRNSTINLITTCLLKQWFLNWCNLPSKGKLPSLGGGYNMTLELIKYRGKASFLFKGNP